MEPWLIASSVLLWIFVLCNLLITLALVRRVTGGTALKKGLNVGQRAPEFTAQTLSGQKVTLATYAGRSVAFIFVSPTCKPCREDLPTYKALEPKAAHAGVELVLVSVVDAEQTQRFVEELMIQLPLLVAPRESNLFLQNYQLTSTPSYCLIDREGRVQSTGSPSPLFKGWRELVEAWEAQEREGVTRVGGERR